MDTTKKCLRRLVEKHAILPDPAVYGARVGMTNCMGLHQDVWHKKKLESLESLDSYYIIVKL